MFMGKMCNHSERVGNYCEHCTTGTGSSRHIATKAERKRNPYLSSDSFVYSKRTKLI